MSTAELSDNAGTFHVGGGWYISRQQWDKAEDGECIRMYRSIDERKKVRYLVNVLRVLMGRLTRAGKWLARIVT